jgi:hypothetical protein
MCFLPGPKHAIKIMQLFNNRKSRWHAYALSQKHSQCMKSLQNYLEKFPKLLGNIEEVRISK